MKVLEQGHGWSIEQRCTGKGNGGGGCNSLLEVEAGDIYQTSSTDYLGDTDYYYTFCYYTCLSNVTAFKFKTIYFNTFIFWNLCQRLLKVKRV